jgi:hypothetical protein
MSGEQQGGRCLTLPFTFVRKRPAVSHCAHSFFDARRARREAGWSGLSSLSDWSGPSCLSGLFGLSGVSDR